MSQGCAAIDDVTAWCILAPVLAIVKSDGFSGSILTIFLILIYAGVMILLLKPFLRRLAPVDHASRHQYNSWAALILYPTQADISSEFEAAEDKHDRDDNEDSGDRSEKAFHLSLLAFSPTSGRGSATKPSRFGIFTLGRLLASITSFSPMMPFKFRMYAATA